MLLLKKLNIHPQITWYDHMIILRKLLISLTTAVHDHNIVACTILHIWTTVVNYGIIMVMQLVKKPELQN